MIKRKGQSIGDFCLNGTSISHYGTEVPGSRGIGGPYDFGNGFPETTKKNHI